MNELLIAHKNARANLNAALTHALAFGSTDAHTRLGLMGIHNRQTALNPGTDDACYVTLYYAEATLLVSVLQTCPAPLPPPVVRCLQSLAGFSVGGGNEAEHPAPPPPSQPLPRGTIMNTTPREDPTARPKTCPVTLSGGVVIGVLLAGLVIFFPVSLVPGDADQMLLLVNARTYALSATMGLVNTIAGIAKTFWEHRAANKR